MKLLKLFVFMAALAVGAAFAPPAEARHVFVSYVDAGRPASFAKADVISAIQRVLREWEAHVSISSFVFHWKGEISLSEAPADFDNVVIRWAGTCPGLRGVSCNSWWGCDDPPGCSLSMPTNHVVIFSNVDPGTGMISNNPRYVPPNNPNLDYASILMHELGHVLRNLDSTFWEHIPTGLSVLRNGVGFASRSLWNDDILGIDLSRYPGHYQALQLFSIDPNSGAMSVMRHYQPTFRVLSPASIAVGDGFGTTGAYLIAYGTRTPAGSSGVRNAIAVKLTDGRTTDTDVIYQGTLNGQDVGTTFHRPCVAVSTNGAYFLVWASPQENAATGARQVLAAESHVPGAGSWSAPVAIPGAMTRSGISCSIDQTNNRLVVAYSNSADERIMLTHRNAWTPFAAWSTPAAVTSTVAGSPASTYGPPDIAFDYFDTFSGIGYLTWQDNADLQVHWTPVYMSSGSYTFGALFTSAVDTTLLRSWPTVSPEINPILGSSLFVLPGNYFRREERRSLINSVLDADTPYQVGPVHASRRYTGAASNRNIFEWAFLSTANTGW